MAKIASRGNLWPISKQNKSHKTPDPELNIPEFPFGQEPIPRKMFGLLPEDYLTPIAIIILILGGIFIYSLAYSQEREAPAAGPKIGDTVPDITINNIQNYKSTTAKLSDFKGKLLILDFWATWCGSCLEAMPKVDSLQKRFGDAIRILPVTSESMATVQGLLSRNPRFKDIELPFAVQDTSLRKLFPYVMVPHYVWIGPEGKVQAITETWALTALNIENALKGSYAGLPLKQDVFGYDVDAPLLLKGNGAAEDAFVYRSLITPYLPGLPAMSTITEDRLKGRLIIKASNQPLPALFNLVYPQRALLPPNFKLLPPNTQNRYTFKGPADERDSWNRMNLYCYELIIPLSKSAQKTELVKQDLRRYFNLEGRMEKRELNCLILQTAAGSSAPDAGLPGLSISTADCSLVNVPLSYLVNCLNSQPGMPPVIDESGFKQNLSFMNAGNLNELQKQLQRKGLRLSARTRLVEVFILEEINPQIL